MAKIEQQDFTPRFNGRVVMLKVFVNTDEDHGKVAQRVTRSARGPGNNACVVMGTVIDGEDGLTTWKALADAAAQSHVHPGAEPLDVAFEPEVP